MEIIDKFYPIERQQWREWLQENFEKKSEVWLVFPNKASGKPGISYNDAVEEALCFGWIDSIQKKLDKDHAVQRYTPRRSKSGFSQPNRERLRWLDAENMIHPHVLENIRDVIDERFVFPEDIMAEIRKDKEAWIYFQHFADSYKRIRIAYIDGARNRPDEFKRRLANFIDKTRQNKKIVGHGGIDKYY